MFIDPLKRNKVYSYNKNYKRVKYDIRDADLKKQFPKPKYLDKIIYYTNLLAKKHFNKTFIRIDFYSTKNGPKFGEFTFRPGNSFLPKIDKYLGQLI